MAAATRVVSLFFIALIIRLKVLMNRQPRPSNLFYSDHHHSHSIRQFINIFSKTANYFLCVLSLLLTTFNEMSRVSATKLFIRECGRTSGQFASHAFLLKFHIFMLRCAGWKIVRFSEGIQPMTPREILKFFVANFNDGMNY